MAETPIIRGLEPKRPWWASALLAGFGSVLAVLLALGFLSSPAKGTEPKSAATIASDNDRLNRIESKIDEALRALGEQGQRISRIEGRMDRK